MGEITEMILDGTFCVECGGVVGDGRESPGYPRKCELCQPKKVKRREVDVRPKAAYGAQRRANPGCPK